MPYTLYKTDSKAVYKTKNNLIKYINNKKDKTDKLQIKHSAIGKKLTTQQFKKFEIY